MLINSPNISGSLRVSGNTVITGSLTTSIAALGTAATTFLTSDGGTIKSRTAAQTLSDLGAQATGSYLTISSATGSYVPYTGATASVNLGYNPLIASNINIDGNAPTAGSYLGFKQATTVNTGIAGYTSISTFGTNRMTFLFAQPTGFRRVSFTVSQITQDVSGGREYALPDANGTIALTTNLGAYLPLTGGAITGSLIVTEGITGDLTGSASTASYVEYTDVVNKPTLVSSSVQIKGYNVFATTGSNQFNGSQTVTGSLTVTGQVIAQTLNVQEVTSSIVFSSGSNKFGNNSGNKHQFTGSLQVTGSSHYVLGNVGIGATSSAVLLSLGKIGTANQIGFYDGATAKGFIGIAAGTSDIISTDALNDMVIRPSASGNLLFAIGSTERMRITSGGNVGVGTASVTTGKLVVKSGESNSTGIVLEGANTSHKLINIFSTTDDGKISIGSGPNTKIFLDSAGASYFTGGNLGVGTATVTTGKFVVKSGESNSTGIVLERGDSTDKLVNIFSTTADGKISIASGATTKIFLDSVGSSYFTGGNVGIGTTSPLQTTGGRTVLTVNGTSSTILNFGISGTLSGYIYSATSVFGFYSQADLYLDAAGANSIISLTNGVERMRITSDGAIKLAGTFTRSKTFTGTANGTDVIFSIGYGFPGGVAGTVKVFAMAGIPSGGSISSRLLTFNFAGGNNFGGSGHSSNVSNSVLGTVASPFPAGTNIDSLSASITSASISGFNISISNTITGTQVTAPTYYIEVTYGLHANATLS
jgi:hypothetical protein